VAEVTRQIIPGTGQRVVAWLFGPSRLSVQLANAMAIATNTFSPMSAGVHNASTQPRGFTGLAGYGVSRQAGRTGALQAFAGAAALPLANPKSRRLGFGAGVAGQPGLPNTGGDGAGPGGASFAQVGRTSMGS
jgi:hypothetical protein